ncbi:L,D-transpeptidase [Pseudoxanthomonas gei]|uniref:L,D-transpeptidase n=2 Tax=Pseudoxanthomonas gei TaxID=1383030 RepID=A0ABX0AEK0_9GAMM|nr:L,D-transpeptidase [Pseudoxanthomonas gei]
MPYMIVDKVQARVFVFDKEGRLQGAGPALLGMERGDGTALGLGERKLAAIAPQERTTPAGRFVASLARDMKGQEILWIDYDSALALHRVVKGTPTERRAERLQSASAEDNRISYGCINVPVAFYEGVVSPAFAHSSGVVYILPETRPAQEVFGSYEVDTGGKSPDSSQH